MLSSDEELGTFLLYPSTLEPKVLLDAFYCFEGTTGIQVQALFHPCSVSVNLKQQVHLKLPMSRMYFEREGYFPGEVCVYISRPFLMLTITRL